MRRLILGVLVATVVFSSGCATIHPSNGGEPREGFFSRVFVPDAVKGASWWKKALWFAGPGH